MHDTDSFARMPALDSTAEQARLEVLLNTFEKECAVTFKGEIYLVRDNGAVFRRARPLRRSRRLDERWTFGTLNRHSGYFEIAGHVVHRIVATAFHGAGPSSDHVVDHIDTNRLNNCPDNLRWVTRLKSVGDSFSLICQSIQIFGYLDLRSLPLIVIWLQTRGFTMS